MVGRWNFNVVEKILKTFGKRTPETPKTTNQIRFSNEILRIKCFYCSLYEHCDLWQVIIFHHMAFVLEHFWQNVFFFLCVEDAKNHLQLMPIFTLLLPCQHTVEINLCSSLWYFGWNNWSNFLFSHSSFYHFLCYFSNWCFSVYLCVCVYKYTKQFLLRFHFEWNRNNSNNLQVQFLLLLLWV